MESASKRLVDQANREITTIPTREAIAMHSQKNVVFVDIREGYEIESEGRIPGAIEVPRGVLEFWADQSHPRGVPELGDSEKAMCFSVQEVADLP